MLPGLITIALTICGAALGGALSYGWTRVSQRALEGDGEMWRMGAKTGPTQADRGYAKRLVESSERFERRFPWLVPAFYWFFRIGGAIVGGAVGYGLARNVGGLT